MSEKDTLLARLKSLPRAREREELAKAREEIAEKNRALRMARRRMAGMEEEIAGLQAGLAEKVIGDQDGGVRPENVVWIFGTGRTGSTWLASMMGEIGGHTVWREPLVGLLFGDFYYVRTPESHGARHFIMGPNRQTWLKSIRAFVLGEAGARFPAAKDGYLVVKEPNGSIGAPLIMEALPESRMLLLVRDPRDVVASVLDARRKGGWRHRGEHAVSGERQEDAAVAESAEKYLQHLGKARDAYEAHVGRKVLIRYEDLRADTLGTMKRLYSALSIPVDEDGLARAVEKHSWEGIPEDERGQGKFYRKATPGGWREDLTPEQARTVESITAPLIDEFYRE